jgi:succinate-acetate transporter protein
MAVKTQKEVITLRDTSANPAPLGLMGFGMTTVLLNLHNIGLFPLGAMILSMGIFYGGFAQIIAGIMEWKKNNTFGETAFISYGFFWLSLGAIILFPIVGWSAEPSNVGMAFYLGMWGIFTAFLFIGTFKLNKALMFVFGSLTLLFLLLSLAHALDSANITKLAGIVGVFCGFCAIYTAMAQVLNGIYGKVVFPLGAIRDK